MKVVILAGGFGSRISEESHLKPKPMIEIGGMPILWHIMKLYSFSGFNEFIICCGYKGYMIKEFFADYYLYRSDITFNFQNHFSKKIQNNISEPWVVTLVDTGLNTMTGGRLKRIKEYLKNETFMLTYGDGLSDIDIKELVLFHKKNKKLATISAVQPGNRFGMLDISDSGMINSFREKKIDDGGWINGGFMVFEPQIIEYIKDDGSILEKDVLEECAKSNQLMAYKHSGFWQCMDTLRDKIKLEELLNRGQAPWKKWD